jgi:hypothetical protein
MLERERLHPVTAREPRLITGQLGHSRRCGRFDIPLLGDGLRREEQPDCPFGRVAARLLLLFVIIGADLVDECDHTLGAAMVHRLARSRPGFGDCLSEPDLTIGVDALHGVTEQPQAELRRERRLDVEKRIHETSCGILALIDQQDRIPGDQEPA